MNGAVARLVAGALGALALAGPVPVAAAPAEPDVPAERSFDDGGTRGTFVATSGLAERFGLLDPGGPTDGVQAAGVEDIVPGDGFDPFHPTAFHWGAYRIELVYSGAAEGHDVDALRDELVDVAAQLTDIHRVTFEVAPALVPTPPVIAQRLYGSHPAPANDPTWGTIRLAISDDSPCGPLVPFGGSGGAIGCGGPEGLYDPEGSYALHTRGEVWVSPSLLNPATNADIASETIAHELGHALGLSHFSPRWPDPGSALQLMYPSVHGEGSDLPSSLFHSGDRNGLWYLNSAWYLSATYRDFLGRLPDWSGYTHWTSQDISAAQYVAALASSNEWVGRIVSQFYDDVFGRPADAGGAQFWATKIREIGVPLVGANLYGSAEYFGAAGGTNTAFVTALYDDLLGRSPDAGGLQYWTGQVAAHGRAVVAFQFFQSLEARLDRVQGLYCSLLDRGADPGGRSYWAGVILTNGDLALAGHLATSEEYFDRADDFALRPIDGPSLPAPCAGY